MIFYDRIPLGGADIQSTKLVPTLDIHGKKTKSYEMHVNGVLVGYGLTLSEGAKLSKEIDSRKRKTVVKRTFGNDRTYWRIRQP